MKPSQFSNILTPQRTVYGKHRPVHHFRLQHSVVLISYNTYIGAFGFFIWRINMNYEWEGVPRGESEGSSRRFMPGSLARISLKY